MSMSITNSTWVAIKSAEKVLESLVGKVNIRGVDVPNSDHEDGYYAVRIIFSRQGEKGSTLGGSVRMLVLLEQTDTTLWAGAIWEPVEVSIVSGDRVGPGAGTRFAFENGQPYLVSTEEGEESTQPAGA